MPAITDFLGRETPLESVRRRRFNPSTARAAGKPTREEQHGQGSDAQHQGKEEAEGRVEQEEERRPHPLAVRVGPGAGSTGPEPLRQEGVVRKCWAAGQGSTLPRSKVGPGATGRLWTHGGYFLRGLLAGFSRRHATVPARKSA